SPRRGERSNPARYYVAPRRRLNSASTLLRRDAISLLVLDLRKLRVDDLFIVGLLRPGSIAALAPGAARRLRFGLRLRVHRFAQLLRRLHQRFALRFQRVLVRLLILQQLLGVLQGRFDLFLVVRTDLVAVFAQRLPHAVHHRVQAVTRLHGLEQLPVFLGVRLGVLDHALDLGFGQARARLDRDLVLLAGRLVLGADVQDAVGVDVERDLDLRHAAR